INRPDQRYAAQQLFPSANQSLTDEVGGKHAGQEHHQQYQHDLETRNLQTKQRLRRQECRYKASQRVYQQRNNPDGNDQGYPDQQAGNKITLEETHGTREQTAQVEEALPAAGAAGAAAGVAAGALPPVSLDVPEAPPASPPADFEPPLRKSVTYQPEPLSWKPAAVSCFS